MKKYIYLWIMMMIPMMGWAQGASPSNMKLFPFKNDSMYTWPPAPLPNNSIYNDIDEMVPQLIGEGISVYSNEEISMFGGSPGKYQTYIYNVPFYTVFYFCKFAFEGSSDIGIDTGWVLSTGPTWPYISYLGEAVPGRQGMSGIAWPAVYNSSALNRDTNAWGPVAQTGFPRPNHAATIPLQDPDLSNLIKDSIYQANVLEFDFIPEGDSIGLDYVFASEEYPNFHPDFPTNSPYFIPTVCDSVTDVMGIFISGPGFNGSENIALIPGTTIPVGINTITPPGWNCPGMPDYSEYYIDNSMGQNVIFNGFTTVLTAKAAVTPGATYRIRIGVAEGALHENDPSAQEYLLGVATPSRTYYDSAIFIKNGGLRSWSDSSVAIHEKEMEACVSIYPNPFSHNFLIKSSNNSSDLLEVYLYNVLGKELFSLKGSIHEINGVLENKDFSGLSSGIYFLKVNNLAESTVDNTKLIKR